MSQYQTVADSGRLAICIGEGVGKRGKARAAAHEIALGEAKELIVALDLLGDLLRRLG